MTTPTRPFDPKCKRYPDEISEYVEAARDYHITPDEYVRREEGTYNRNGGHFLCTDCYIAAGMPSKPYPQRWVCP